MAIGGALGLDEQSSGFRESFGSGRGSAGTPKAWEPDALERKILADFHATDEDRDLRQWNEHFQRVWFECLAMIEGAQYLYWNHFDGALAIVHMPTWQRRVVVNKLLPALQRAMSMLSSTPLDVAVAPATSSSDDRVRAQTAQKLWEAFTETEAWQSAEEQIRKMSPLLGNGFTKLVWDTSLGRVVGQHEGEAVYEGDVAIHPVPPWGLLADPFAKDILETEWVEQTTLRSIGAIRAKWGDRGHLVRPDATSRSFNVWRMMRALTLSGRGGDYAGAFTDILGTSATHEDSEPVVVRERWRRPTREFPDGIHAVFASGVLLNPQNRYVNEYAALARRHALSAEERRFYEIPYDHCRWFRGTERLYGTGMIQNAVPIQIELNTNRSQISEHIDMTNWPPWKLPFNHGVNVEALQSGMKNTVIEYNATAGVPSREPIPALPAHVFAHSGVLGADLQDAIGQHDATQGQVPSGGRTGIMLELLQGADAQILSEPAQNYARWLQSCGKRYLMTVSMQYDEKRVARYRGAGGGWEAMFIRGADIAGASDLRYRVDYSMGKTPEGRKAYLMDLISLGVLNMQDPEHQRIVAEMLEMRATTLLAHEMTLDRQSARKENALMLTMPSAGGLPPMLAVHDWEDHDDHYQEHNRERRDPNSAYWALAPALRRNFDEHCEWHAQMIAQAMMAAQSMAAGAPAEKGVASQPKRPATSSETTDAQQSGGQLGGLR